MTNRAHAVARRRTLLRHGAAIAAAAVLAPHRVRADDARPLRLLVPFARGGRAGFFAERVQPALQQRLQRPVALEFHPEGGSPQHIERFAQDEAREPASGAEIDALLLTAIQLPRVGAGVHNPFSDLLGRLVPVSFLARDPQALVMPTARAEALRIGDGAALLQALRRQPGRLNGYTWGGPGAASPLACELFKSLARVYFTRRPLPAAVSRLDTPPPADADLLFMPLHQARRGLIRGAWRLIGATCTPEEARSGLDAPGAADALPTLAALEPALARCVAYDPYCLLAPPGTAPAAAERLQGAVADALMQPAVRDALLRASALPGGETPGAFVAAEQATAERRRLAHARW